MSIATLFRHVGIDVQRFVTVDGTVVTDPGLAPGGLSVEPHRFHGGPDPVEAAVDFSAAWWNTDEKRRSKDETAMRTFFPNFKLHTENDDYVWIGDINSGRGTFKVAIVHRADGELPLVASLSKKNFTRMEGRRSRRSPHLYDSGLLCVAAQSDWNPTRHTSATVVGWTAHWFAAYTVWSMSGVWPTDGYGQVA